MGWRSVLAGFVFHARYEALLDLREDRVSSRCHKRCRRGLACGSLRDSSTARQDEWAGPAKRGQCSKLVWAKCRLGRQRQRQEGQQRAHAVTTYSGALPRSSAECTDRPAAIHVEGCICQDAPGTQLIIRRFAIACSTISFNASLLSGRWRWPRRPHDDGHVRGRCNLTLLTCNGCAA